MCVAQIRLSVCVCVCRLQPWLYKRSAGRSKRGIPWPPHALIKLNDGRAQNNAKMQLEHVLAIFRSGRWHKWTAFRVSSWQQITHAVEVRRDASSPIGRRASKKSIYSRFYLRLIARLVLCPIHSRKRLLRAKFGAPLTLYPQQVIVILLWQQREMGLNAKQRESSSSLARSLIGRRIHQSVRDHLSTFKLADHQTTRVIHNIFQSAGCADCNWVKVRQFQSYLDSCQIHSNQN